MKRSPERNTFQANGYIQRCQEQGKEPNPAYIEMYEDARQRDLEREQDEEWKQNNLEYDLRSTEWICAKARASKSYSQNIYAALCNTEWQRNDVWPLLKDQRWSCSWRYAGGIVANMREQGDYIDWYCSGIRDVSHDEKENKVWDGLNYVAESVVTEEIKQDFFQLGWIQVHDGDA